MINPLLNHPLLQHLPYQQLKNPTPEGIKLFVRKRRRNLIITGIVLFILAIVSLLSESKVNLFSFIYPLILTVLAVGLYKQAAKSKINDEEIDKMLLEFSSYNNSKPA